MRNYFSKYKYANGLNQFIDSCFINGKTPIMGAAQLIKIFRVPYISFRLNSIFILSFFAMNLASAQQLDALIDEALIKNPEIEKLELQYQIAKEKINEANSWPNTQFNLGIMAIKPEMDMPMEQFSVSAMQMFPWFGLIEAKENYASALSQTKLKDIEIAQRKLGMAVSNLYYLLFEIREKQKVLSERIEVLKTYEKLAVTSVEVGRASVVDVLKFQIRQNELLKQKDILSEQDQGIESALNSLLNRPIDQEITVVGVYEIPENLISFEFDALATNPEITRYQSMLQEVELFEELNQKESAPSFGVGIEYINLESSPMINSAFKGMVMPMVTLSVPIFNKKFKSRTIQNQLQLNEIQAQKNERLNKLKADLAKAISQLNQAKISYYNEAENLTRTEKAEEILIRTFETAAIDFRDAFDVQDLHLKFQMNQIEAIKNYQLQLTLINYLIH